jgi:DNA polymerase-3 subunit delta'
MWNVIERADVVSKLQSGLRAGRLPNAYLLVGPAHIGKMTLAINLSQALNCNAIEKPCGECVSCRKIAAGKHADVQVIGLVSTGKEKLSKEISIDQVRDMQHSANLPPFEGCFKVFIIDGAELLSNEASNCLLKALEEPVENVLFILLTANERRLLPTVISRCQRLELLPLPPASIEKKLLDRGIEADRARLFSRLAHGCPGWAISASDSDFIVDERAEKMETLQSIMRSGMEERFAYAAQLAAQFSRDRQSVQDELALWLDWWHDLLLIKLGSPKSITNIDFAATLIETAAKYDLIKIRTFISHIQEAALQLNMNASPRLVLEVLMLYVPSSRLSGIRTTPE